MYIVKNNKLLLLQVFFVVLVTDGAHYNVISLLVQSVSYLLSV